LEKRLKACAFVCLWHMLIHCCAGTGSLETFSS
jgi:hypothetical protein